MVSVFNPNLPKANKKFVWKILFLRMKLYYRRMKLFLKEITLRKIIKYDYY